VTRDRDTIVSLVGLRCSGKSSVGRELAELLDRPFVDLDVELARDFASGHGAATTAGEILAQHGESVFRDAEERTLERVLARDDAFVVATGGGVVERANNRALLRLHTTCVWLRVPTEELERRMRADKSSRPALSHHGIDCGTRDPQDIARSIAALFAGGRR
jgi:shikimate kinase